MSSRHGSTAAGVILGTCAVVVAPMVSAQELPKAFHIATGPATRAIAEFAKQSSLNVLSDGAILDGVRTNALDGSYPPLDAMKRMLAGTGLACRINANGAIIVSLAPREPEASAAHPPPAVAEARSPTPVVMVSGTRQALITTIERKRVASATTDSIVAEDIGQFPDKNLGESLSRITGVQVSMEFGEGNQISIRGIQPDLNRIEINGMTLLSTAEAGTRAPEMREIPSELIKSIDVIKGTTADTTEGGLGGTVKITTNKPLDFKRLTIAAHASAERNSLRGGTQPRASLLIADRLLAGRLGLMANLVADNVLTEADRVRNTGWRFLRDWDFAPDKTVQSTNPAAAAVSAKAGCAAMTGANRSDCERQWYDYSPATPRYGIWTRDHRRRTGEFTAQYAFDKNFSAWAAVQRIAQDSWINDRNYTTDFTSADRLAGAGTLPVYSAAGVPNGGTCITPGTAATPAGVVVSNHQVTEYVVGNCLALAGRGGNGAFSTQARDFNQHAVANYRSVGFNVRRDAWDANGLLISSRASYANDSNFIGLTMNAPGLKVSLDARGFPHFSFPAGFDPENAGAYTQAQFNFSPVEVANREDQVKLDFHYRMDRSLLTRLSFGVQGRRSSSVKYADGGYVANAGSNLTSTVDDLDVLSPNVRYTWNYDPLNPTAALRPATVQPFVNGNDREIWVTADQMRQLVQAVRSAGPDFLSGLGLRGFPATWMVPNYDAALPLFDTGKFNHDLVRQAPARDGNLYPQIPTYGVNEWIRAAYVRLDYATSLFGYTVKGNVGLRYAGTRDRSTGRLRLLTRAERSPGSATYDDRLVGNSIVSRDNAYHDLLPSLNAAVWLNPKTLVLRLGAGKVMARPSLDRLSPNIVCTLGSGNPQFGGDGHDTCTAGNPNLRPYRAIDEDAALEWYPRRDTQFSLALFRKDIRTSILNNAVVRQDILGTGTLFDVTTTANYGGATTKGIELAGRSGLTFLPGLLSGLGIDANYTRMGYRYAPGAEMRNQLDGTILPFPGMSRRAGNLGIWYERGRVNARLAYNYRSGYYTGTNDANTGNPAFLEPTGFVDAKFQYRIDDQLSVSFEAKNLTDEVTLTTAGTLSRPNELSWSGRRYFVGLSYKH